MPGEIRAEPKKSPWTLRRRIGAGLFGVLGLFLACAPLKIDTRSVFADLTYSPPSDAGAADAAWDGTPPSKWDVLVMANLELEAITAYRHPAEMAGCLRSLDRTPTVAEWQQSGSFPLPEAGAPPSYIEWLGEQLSAAGTHWAEVARGISLNGPCGQADEPAFVRYVVARIATAATTLAHSVSITEDRRRELVYRRVPAALDAIARILAATPHRSPATEDAPALALSGGSSNGAFTAGFLFELLSLRERALPPEGDGGKFRFSAIVGTSVGSLITQILDLYFVDAALPLGNKEVPLKQCNSYWVDKPKATCPLASVDTATSSGNTACFDGWPNTPGQDLDTGLSGLDPETRGRLITRRPRQMCTLTDLYRYFTDDGEQTLMCVEPGPLTTAFSLLGRRTENLMRFDPMYLNIVGPLLDDYSDEMTRNDVTRVVVSVETQQNQILGLDERICANLPSAPAVDGGPPEPYWGREYCLGSGVMASVVLPFFAHPVRHTYGGVRPQGLCGTWFDGGLRSGFPVYRALRMTRPALQGIVGDDDVRLRVLAISTGRLEGEALARPQNIADVAFDAIDQMSDQNQLDEVIHAQQMALIREDELSEIMGHRRGPRPATGPGGSITEDQSVSTVFVPADVPDQIVAGGEYSFDRYIMRGLWIWGRYLALQRVLAEGGPVSGRGLFWRLGWRELDAKARELAARELDPKDKITIVPWIQAYRLPECNGHYVDRLAAGKQRVLGCVKSCPPVVAGGTDFPQFLLCPDAGARDP